MEIKGKIIKVLPLITGVSQKTGNSYAKQSYIIQTEEQYPQSLCFSVFGQDKIDQFCIREGQYRIVKFSVRANEIMGDNGIRVYNEVNAWSCELDATRVQPSTPQMSAPQPQQYAAPYGYAPQQPQQGYAQQQTNQNDLPF